MSDDPIPPKPPGWTGDDKEKKSEPKPDEGKDEKEKETA